MKKSIYLDREDIKKVEKEEQLLFILSILTQIGIGEDDLAKCFPLADEDETVEHRLERKRLCRKYHLDIIYSDRAVEISVQNEVIGRWNKPLWKLRVDSSSKKKVFVEMIIESWDMFEENK